MGVEGNVFDTTQDLPHLTRYLEIQERLGQPSLLPHQTRYLEQSTAILNYPLGQCPPSCCYFELLESAVSEFLQS